eukprot:CAMPEP_0181257476 /NCGR_PEP_ID=MMETSP1096-20121128/50265_1 /TAXON_ID=156174 ORGANISM="Chrysochromulina ericina, Strain CCMP281" /NCGR_SAMPLE_ID=MMETSP1096 /ASSEMBLY_ACC=CAM_ASM_000453 /LENGTH=613 /DNA_ID=CAMNT_0023355797 /DNA_START=93 /DNA_END=1934 /DNA_ORIENTATION=-
MEFALRAASKIRDPHYSLSKFYDDVTRAFPELTLYMVISDEAKAGGSDVSSGVTPAAEYRRTIGAMFAVYWLMRIGIDGELGFSFGVDEHWAPRPPCPPTITPSGAQLKRQTFYEKQEWRKLQDLLVDAQMLHRKEDDEVEVDIERTLALLALTAFHDVMKVEALLPRVLEDHHDFCGFKAGDVINDHDIALGYVLEHFSDTLPSFVALPAHQQKSVRFTQAKMGFNHGWLVQAEAPPSALFGKFKQVILKDTVVAADVAFYFVHWLTDLAGAEPSPLEGSEKFVLKFPMVVLASFIKSFSVINELAHKTETEVMEDYLVSYWDEAGFLGPMPVGSEAIAVMRLIVQAQTADKQVPIPNAFRGLSQEDKQVLSEEMARTGAANQDYNRSTPKTPGGPAFLIYYSPAFVRKLTPDSTENALALLAEVYRRARRLWPLDPNANTTVTVRIDQIKELTLQEIQAVYAVGDSWLLSRRNDLEAVVERHPLDYMGELLKQGYDTTVLKFYDSSKKAYGSMNRATSANRTPPSDSASPPGVARTIAAAPSQTSVATNGPAEETSEVQVHARGPIVIETVSKLNTWARRTHASSMAAVTATVGPKTAGAAGEAATKAPSA